MTMAGRVTALLFLALASPVAGGLTGCRLAQMITGKGEGSPDLARGDLIEALGDQIEADRQEAATTRLAFGLGAGALLLAGALILFFFVRGLVRLLRREPAPVRSALVEAAPTAAAAEPLPAGQVSPQPVAGVATAPLASPEESFEAFVLRSFQEGTAERIVALESAERLERLGSDIAAGDVPLEGSLTANALPIAEDWSFCRPLVEHLRRLGPAGENGAGGDGAFRNAEWLGSLAAISLASWCEGPRV